MSPPPGAPPPWLTTVGMEADYVVGVHNREESEFGIECLIEYRSVAIWAQV